MALSYKARFHVLASVNIFATILYPLEAVDYKWISLNSMSKSGASLGMCAALCTQTSTCAAFAMQNDVCEMMGDCPQCCSSDAEGAQKWSVYCSEGK